MDAQAACPALCLLLLLLAAPCWALRVGIGETTLTARELLAWAGPLPNGILSLVPETRDDAAPGKGGPLQLPAASVALAGRGSVVPARLLAQGQSGNHAWVPGDQMPASLVQAPMGASEQVPQPLEAPPPSPMPADPEPPFTLISWWQLATELQMSGPAVELAPVTDEHAPLVQAPTEASGQVLQPPEAPPPAPMPADPEPPFTLISWWQLATELQMSAPAVELASGQDLTLTSLSLFLVDLSAPLGYHVTLPTLALASLFAVPVSAKLLLQDMVVVLSAVDLHLVLDGICSAYDTDSFPYSPGVVVDGFVVRLIDHTSRAPDENGTAGAGGEVRWINVTLTCPGCELNYPPCAARPIREGWELDAAVLRPLLEATVGPMMLSLAPDVALPAGGSWTQVGGRKGAAGRARCCYYAAHPANSTFRKTVKAPSWVVMVPVNRLLVLIGDPSLQLRRGRPTTLDLAGVEEAWALMRDGRFPWVPHGSAQLRDLQLVNLPYSSMPRESLGLLALSMQSFGLTWCVHAQDASGPASNGDQPPQLNVSRCTLVVSDPELAFLARAAAASVRGQGQPNLTALFGDEAGQPRVGGDPLMDGAEGTLLLEFLQLRSLVGVSDRVGYSTRTAITGISTTPTAAATTTSFATTCAIAAALAFATPFAATLTPAAAAASLAAAIATLLDDHAHRSFGVCGLIKGKIRMRQLRYDIASSGISVASYSYASGVLLLSEARWYGVYGMDVTVSYMLPDDAPPGAALLSYPPLVLPYQELADLNIDIEVDFSPPLLPPPSAPSQRTPPDLATTSPPTPAMAQPAPARPLASDPFNTPIGGSAAGRGSTGVSPTGRSPLLPTSPAPRPEAPPSANGQLPRQQPFSGDGLPGEGPPDEGSRGAKPAWRVPVAATVSTVGAVAGLAAAVCIVLAFVKRRQQRGCGATERGPGWIGKHNCAATGRPRSGSSTWGVLLPMTGAQASMVCIRLDSLHEKEPVAATTVACDQTSSSGVGSTDVGAPEQEGSHFVIDGGGGGQGSGERGPLGGPAIKGSGSHLWSAPGAHQRSLASLTDDRGIGGSNTAGSAAATSFTVTTTTTARASSQTSMVRALVVMAAADRAPSLSAIWRRMTAKARSGGGAPNGGSSARAPPDPGFAHVGQGIPAGTVEVAAKAGMGEEGAAGAAGSQGSARALRLAPQQLSGATASTAALANRHALQLALLRLAEAEAEAAAAAAVASGASSADEAALWAAQAVERVQDVQLDCTLPAVAASALGIPPPAPDAVGSLPLGRGPRPSEQPLEEELQAYFTNLADSVMRGMESRQPALSPVDESARQQGGMGGAQQMARSIQLLHAQLRDPDLEVHAVLGLGSYGVVYNGMWRGLPVAVKTLVVPAAAAGVEGLPGLAGSRDARTRQRAVLEAAISLSMSHPNVVATFAYELKPLVQQPSPGSTPNRGSESISGGDRGGAARCVEEADGHKLYIVQELCNGGSLAQALAAGMAGNIIAGGLSRRLALRLALDVALGMAHVHGCRIVHGDLKPGNVLLSSGARHNDQCVKQIVEAAAGEMPHGPASAGPSIDPGRSPSPGRCVSCRDVGSSSGDTLPLMLTAKVADFGLSLPLQEGATHTSNCFQGTPLYCAPEVISAGHLSTKADVWSFGVMLLELFYGCTMQTIRSLHDTVQCGLRQGRPLAAGLPQARSIEMVEGSLQMTV
ncbi:putative serine/threonine-protein kinase [Tetrabaena socialis]|uniref:Putative serine/threonine-protein kinase n=1 Tax=Tetrabaena socialis TaxID=47790 RepID=A0A2J8AD06_9CHLO|nr:putative serine/threonine-protein kinase [Tetrabaena socialis]|eukprot:PNH10405.1 putative serine/threonine-protein kinase [Tetrabaena socialis]